MHAQEHPLAGKTVQLGSMTTDPTRGIVEAGVEYRIEDWWDRLYGKSWMLADGNPAAMQYAIRTGMAGANYVPLDDEVVYGKIGRFGHLVHVSELGDVVDGD